MILFGLVFALVVHGNPVFVPAITSAADRLYMSSEQLAVRLSPSVAELRGMFTFAYRQDVLSSGQSNLVQLNIPIWFPQSNPKDPTVTAFLKAFRKDQNWGITPSERAAFEKAIGLNIQLGNEKVPINELYVFMSTNRVFSNFPAEWWQEPGFCCVVVRVYFSNDQELTQKRLTLTYRQPLLPSKGNGLFFYLPELPHLPASELTDEARKKYAITLIAQPQCSINVQTANQSVIIEPGESAVIHPQHHLAIRATVTPLATNAPPKR